VGIELSDVVLESLDPALLLSNPLVVFFLAVVNQLCKVVSQPFVLLVTNVGEGGTDNANDGRGEGSRM